MSRFHATDAAMAAVALVSGLFFITGRPGPAMGVLVSAPAVPDHQVVAMPPDGLKALIYTATIDGVDYRAEMSAGVTPEGASVLVEVWTADGLAIDPALLPEAVQPIRAKWVAWSITTVIRDRRDIGGGTA
jgi:hypothetical protein